MFCGQCGSQVADGSPFCPNCGAQLSSGQTTPVQPYQQQAQPYQQQAQPYQQQAQPYQAQQYQQYQQPNQQYYGAQNAPGVYANPAVNPQYQSLGGWLLVIVILQIIGVIANIGSLISDFNEWSSVSSFLNSVGYGNLNMLMTVYYVLLAAIIVADIVLIYFIVARKDIFLKFYQVLAICSIAIVLLMGMALAAMPEVSSFAGDYFSSVGPSLVGSIVGVVLYTLYFCKSVRVRTYMGSTSYIEKALFKIGA